MSTYTIGIDFGTTKTLVARVNPDTKEVEYLRLGRANNHMPTAIAIRNKGGELFFGDDADDKLKESEEYDYNAGFKLELGDDTEVCQDNQSHSLTAKDLTREFLKYVRGKAEEEWSTPGRQLGKVVITYPVTFSRVMQEDLRQAAAAAGFHHVELELEPEAAGHAYYIDGKEKAKNKILVVDWGGGTLDISLITREGESFDTHRELSDGDMNMGGEIFDDRLWEYVKDKLEAQGVTFTDDSVARKMRSIVREAKERLSSKGIRTLYFKLEGGKVKSLQLTRADFNKLIADSVSKAVDKVQNIIAKAAADQKPEMLLLVGGSSRIPLIKQELAAACSLPVCTWPYSREAVARGAAFIAADDRQDASAASDAAPEQQTELGAQTTSMSADELNDLGMCYWNGDGQPQDFERAARCFRQAAQQGHREAQYNFAQCCRQGKGGVQKDAKQAAHWFQKAAEQGEPSAQYRMGLCYQKGEGVPKDDQQAIYWFQCAAANGHKKAQNSLNQYNKERETNANHHREEASALGAQTPSMNADELNDLGMCYWNGDGQPQDFVRAADCFHQAAQQGHREAQYNFAQCYLQGKGVPKDAKQATHWFQKAAEQGDPDAQYRMGLCYRQGKGVPKDAKQAAHWFQKAAKQGDPDAQYRMGLCYQQGEGVRNINISLALHWFQLAAANGHKGAQKFLNQYNKEREANVNHLRGEASAPSYPTEQQTSNHTPTSQAPQVSKKGLSGGAIVGIFWGGIIALGLISVIISNFWDIIEWIIRHPPYFAIILSGIGLLYKELSR